MIRLKVGRGTSDTGGPQRSPILPPGGLFLSEESVVGVSQ